MSDLKVDAFKIDAVACAGNKTNINEMDGAIESDMKSISLTNREKITDIAIS
jgi:hypothetical protein